MNAAYNINTIESAHYALCDLPQGGSGLQYVRTKRRLLSSKWTVDQTHPVPLCSMRCSALYAGLCLVWEVAMLAPDRLQKIEALARERCLGPLGDVVAGIGMDRPVSDYSKADVLSLITAVITAYQGAVVEIGEQVLAREREYFAARGRTHPLDEVPF